MESANDNLDLIHNETGFVPTAFGGTELMMRRLYRDMPRDLLEKFQIIPTRVNALDGEKVRILWIHDLAGDPSCSHLTNGGWQNFHKIVFVSNWQQQRFIEAYQIPWSHTTVIHNAIEPIQSVVSWEKVDKVNLVYHTTPHRGLEIVVPVFKKLTEKYGNKIHLNVYSSYGIYGWSDRDKQFEKVFQQMEGVENISNHGAKTNQEIREHLSENHIFAYPSIWPETSCLSLIEAMSAGLICVHSSLGALFETSGGWTVMYDFDERPNNHAGTFYKMLEITIDTLFDKPELFVNKQKMQKQYIDSFYNWEVRKGQWQHLLTQLKDLPTDIPDVKPAEEMFNYNT